MNNDIFGFLKKINLNNITSNINKSLNIFRKSIPIYKEVRPYFLREKSLFKNENIKKESNEELDSTNSNLTFFQ
ncbi:MAG: hypothetical protein IJ966_04010 [Bacilli bacterium]|nr:hypothetical protein [Bacilli bacterium]